MTKPDTGIRRETFGPFLCTADLLGGWTDVTMRDPDDAFPFAFGRSRLWDVGEVGTAIGSCIGVRDKRVPEYLTALHWALDLLRMPEGARVDQPRQQNRRARWLRNRLRAQAADAKKAAAKVAPRPRRQVVAHG